MSQPYRTGGGTPSDPPAPSFGVSFRAATVEDGARERELYPPYLASGRKLGHGTAAWLPAPPEEMRTPGTGRPDSAFAVGRPVVALLDTGVQDHDALLLDGGEPYWAEAVGWVPPLDIPTAEPGVYGSHWGHATFLAGLIRLAAPDARVLSLRVMDDSGRASDTNVAAALAWLADERTAGLRIDVVLTAFGRHAETDDPELVPVRAALARLAGLGVPVVASAGNGGSERPVYPAAFTGDPRLSVVSVGARVSPTERAWFSNHGVWVREWGAGTNVVSTMPLRTTVADGGGFAYWSGTSFPAASHAGALAQATADRSA
ncbi:S8 family peptidase [Micromonospora vulcania]|uniref:S8 family serine peptidase n=1 Tax=Micromonospora vulcania TaxID=1441873 RepID=A0ABW1H6M7_9ACTN